MTSKLSLISLSQICIFGLILIANSVVSQNPNHHCISENADSGFNNQCTSKNEFCGTFIIYRAQNGYSKLSSIAFLFNKTTIELLSYNNISQNDQEFLHPGREIIIPVSCSCSGTFFRDNFEYNSSQSESFSSIACETFEGLVKVKNLKESNREFESGDNLNKTTTSIQVPVKCSCPNKSNSENDTSYMVTYPIMEYDETDLIALKFGVSEKIIRYANGLGPLDAIFPGTTLFIPMNKTPVLNLNVSESGPRAMIPGRTNESKTTSRNVTFYVMVGGLVFAGITIISIVFGTLIYVWLRNRPALVQSLSRKMRISPDFLDGILKIKQSITYFSLDELKIATQNFNESSVLSCGVYKGKIGDSYVVIKQVNSRKEADRVNCILTKIYHFNIVKLEGVCEGTAPFLAFEFAENGCLRECLSNSKLATWRKRMEIILDVAQGLHYLHYFTKPTYVHRNINSGNILITASWRAKISGFGSARALNCSYEKGENNSRESFTSREEFLAPEFHKYGQVSSKVDVYAFGIVLLELLSGKVSPKSNNGNLLNDFRKFSSNAKSLNPFNYLEKLGNFMDPLLGRDYPTTDVLYIAFLAEGCTEDDPFRRPTMNDILKALSNFW